MYSFGFIKGFENKLQHIYNVKSMRNISF